MTESYLTFLSLNVFEDYFFKLFGFFVSMRALYLKFLPIFPHRFLGKCACLWLIQVYVWQKPSQYCKAIILQLKSLAYPGGLAGKESACNAGDLSLIPGSGRFPGEGNGNHSSILTGKFHGQRSLARHSPWDYTYINIYIHTCI